MTTIWRPESFSGFPKRLVTDPEGAGNALDLTFQNLSTQTLSNTNNLAALQPIGGTTKNRPASPALYSWFYDSTLGKPIMFVGQDKWIDATGAFV